jgi:integrase
MVYNGKGSKDRVVPLTTKAAMVVADMDLTEGLKPEDHLWSTKPGGGTVIKRRDPISNTAMQGWWANETKGVLARAGVPYRNMHVTRHTFATRLIRLGARIENVQLLMGHSSIQTTVNLYAHLNVEDARADLLLLELVDA